MDGKTVTLPREQIGHKKLRGQERDERGQEHAPHRFAARRGFGNIVGHATDVSDMRSLSSWTAQKFDPALSWDDVAWIKQRWGGKLIIKGIMDPLDARLAADSGADALIVSNHGGRQLDGAQSSIAALPAIVAAVGKEIEVHMDGGVRSGQDVIRALALGAKGVYIGRPFLYGLGALGEQGRIGVDGAGDLGGDLEAAGEFDLDFGALAQHQHHGDFAIGFIRRGSGGTGRRAVEALGDAFERRLAAQEHAQALGEFGGGRIERLGHLDARTHLSGLHFR